MVMVKTLCPTCSGVGTLPPLGDAGDVREGQLAHGDAGAGRRAGVAHAREAFDLACCRVGDADQEARLDVRLTADRERHRQHHRRTKTSQDPLIKIVHLIRNLLSIKQHMKQPDQRLHPAR